MIPFESTAPQADVVREGPRPNNQQSVQVDQGLPHPAHIFTTGVVRRSRTIYWSPNQSSEDIKAQIIVALIQLRLLGDPTSFVRWLERYTLQNFKIVASLGSEYRPTIARDTISNILSHHGLNEDYRAWRKYLRFYVNRVTRNLFSNSPEVPDADSIPWEEGIGSSLVSTSAGGWSVADCARELGVSWQWANSLIRKLVREGKLIPLQTNPMRIAESHVDMLVRGRKRRVRQQRSRHRKRKKLEQQGLSFEAARKAINRKRGRLPAILESKDKSES